MLALGAQIEALGPLHTSVPLVAGTCKVCSLACRTMAAALIIVMFAPATNLIIGSWKWSRSMTCRCYRLYRTLQGLDGAGA